MDLLNPKQTILFPEFLSDQNLPSITTLPDYDKAIENFIKMSDYGAFIDLNVAGIEKSMSFSLNELKIPRRYRQTHEDQNSPVFHLFPATIRNHLNRLKYDARAFFTRYNSVKTGFGTFLFRQYFSLWDQHRGNFISNIKEYLETEIGEPRYRTYFTDMWNEAVGWLREGIKRRYRHLLPTPNYNLIQNVRGKLSAVNMTISHLDQEDPEYFLNCFVLKTIHIPTSLADYITGITIQSTFKTIHLEYLKHTTIDSIEDLLNFFEQLPEKL